MQTVERLSENRFVPTADILPWLDAAYLDALEGTQRVITRFTESNLNLSRPFEKIIQAAGLNIWPKLIQNLRASCETDWLDSGIAADVVAKWIGHSVKVQNDNYAQVDDHHFDQFNERASALQKIDTENRQVGHQVGHKLCEMAKNGKPIKQATPEKVNVFRGSAGEFASLRKPLVPEVGLEPTHDFTHTGF